MNPAVKFFVKWELVLAFVALKTALLAGWIASVSDYSGGFTEYSQVWFAAVYGLLNLFFLLGVGMFALDEGAPWRKYK